MRVVFNKMFCFLLLVCFVTVIAKDMHIAIRENLTQTCPNVESDVIVKDSIQFSFDLISGDDSGDKVTVTDVYGQTKTIYFPACYKAKLSFKVKKPLKNPYVEAFLQMGQNLPCSSEENTNICTNITQSNWCPKSTNNQLRSMLRGKKTCQFCNLCQMAKLENEETNTIRKYISEEEGAECDTTKLEQALSFTMCSPSRAEIDEQEEGHRDTVEKYSHYLKQGKRYVKGVLTAVVHVLDRDEVHGQSRQRCKQMCNTLQTKKAVSNSYKSSLLRTIETMCSPQDAYAACVYHTVKFDINEQN